MTESLPKLPAGNFAGYIDDEYVFAEDRQLPFPHLRAVPVMVRYVLTIERDDHPERFDRSDRSNRRDVDVTSLVRGAQLTYDQNLVPGCLKQRTA